MRFSLRSLATATGSPLSGSSPVWYMAVATAIGVGMKS
jgi:hypothetical protein